MMSEFRVGMKVRVRTDVVLTDHMKRFQGMVGDVVSVYVGEDVLPIGVLFNGDAPKLDEEDFILNASWFYRSELEIVAV